MIRDCPLKYDTRISSKNSTFQCNSLEVGTSEQYFSHICTVPESFIGETTGGGTCDVSRSRCVFLRLQTFQMTLHRVSSTVVISQPSYGFARFRSTNESTSSTTLAVFSIKYKKHRKSFGKASYT